MGALSILQVIGAGLGWIWNHKTLSALILCAVALAWSRHEVSTLTIERDAARSQIEAAQAKTAVAERQAAISAADAERWQKASADRDSTIQQLTAQIEEQNAAIEAAASKRADLLKALDGARIENDRLSQTAADLARELDDEAKAAPADVRSIGPIVQRRVNGLFN
jgi:chromosome segregation ATPase